MNHNQRSWKIALLDLDGTLFRGTMVIEGAPEFVERLRQRGIQPVFFTNNSTRTPDEVACLLQDFGIAATSEEICTTSQATAAYLSNKLGQGKTVCYTGRRGLQLALEQVGLETLSVREEEFSLRASLAEAAVVGLDQQISYQQLGEFCRVVSRLGEFILTNPDVRLPSEDGFLPGNGALGAFVSCATGITPIVIGKPQARFVEYALQRYRASRSETLIIGDNLHTDIKAANASGVYSIHVQSGVQVADGQGATRRDKHSPHQQDDYEPEPMPDEIHDSVADLFL